MISLDMCAMLAMVRWEYDYVAQGCPRRMESSSDAVTQEPVSA